MGTKLGRGWGRVGSWAAPLATAALLVGSACATEPLGDGATETVTCSTCHGNSVSPAPPKALDGSTSRTSLGVGAHRAHLTDSPLRAAMACDECHVVPETVDAPGHVDALPAEVTFGTLATSRGVEPTWDRDAATCSNVYCHGATLQGGSVPAPNWTVADGSQARCGACHGAPPPSPHPQSDQCSYCHPQTVAPDGTILVAQGKHINGVVDARGWTCTDCHGSDVNAAPPVSVEGLTETSEVAVGAHQAHLVDGPLRLAVACDECHVVPDRADAPGHLGPLPAEVTFGTLAKTGVKTGGLDPQWDRASHTCSNVYCHGSTLGGGSQTSPDWTVVDGTQAACGTCHGFPPPAPHPDRTDCSVCHGDTVNPDGTIALANGTHIDGTVEVAAACNACHGGEDNPAPPVSVAGLTATTETEVGAHQAHLHDGVVRQAVACAECHVVPAAVGDAGHLDAAPAEVTFGPLATAGGAEPTWDRATNTCSNVYCHGDTLAGGQHTAPDWTLVDGSQAGCASCHGFPPPAPHPDDIACGSCHTKTVTSGGAIDIDGGAHINGKLDF